MANYSLQKGAERNRKILIMKKVLLIVFVVSLAGLWLSWSAGQDAKLMSIQYCWDSAGNHFVAPNSACRN